MKKIISLLSLINCSSEKNQADLVIRNAKIYTVNDAFDLAEAMAIKDGKIIAIGAEYEIINKYHSPKKLIDAKKKTIYPGLIDAHCHFVGYAQNLNQVNLVGTSSFDEVIDRVVHFADKNKPEWIIGRGWDQNDWEDTSFPVNDKLDSLFPSTPVLLTRIDGHAAIANSKALSIANITTETKIDGGMITFKVPKNGKNIIINNNELNGRSNDVEPTGILIDNAIELVTQHIPEISQEDLTDLLLTAQQHLFKFGITTVDDAGLELSTINLINHLHQNNQLQLKVYAMITGNKEILNHYLEKGPYKTDKLSVCSFKFYADGALGSRGACLIEPYADVTEKYYGLLLHQKDFFEKYAQLIYDKGFQMNTHCIGDSANRMILNIYANVLKGTNDKRWRIEHAQIVHPNDFEKFKDYNIIPSVQPTHATSDMYWAGKRLGKDKVKYAYAFQQLLQQNGMIALGTDFPIEDINPFKTFYAAVLRKDAQGFPKNGYQKENALSREEALRGMTIWAAIANFEEDAKGSLEVGKAADFILLDTDIMTAQEEAILSTQVVATYIDGELVYKLKNK